MKIKSLHQVTSIVICIAACLASAFAQQAQPSPDSSASPSLVTQAEQLIAAGRTDAGLEMLTAAAKSSPNDVRVRYLLGTTYYRKADYRRAVQYLSAITAVAGADSPQHRQAVQMLAMSYYLLGQFRDAIPHLEQVAAATPQNAELSFALGVCYLRSQDRIRARATFARMYNVPLGSASAYLLNAQMMIRQGLEEQAEVELQRAAALDPKLPQVHFILGELAIYKARIDEGIEQLNQEIALNPAFGMAYYRLGEAYSRQLKWDAAIPPLQKSIWLNPYFSGPYIVLGKVYLKQNNFETAEAMLRRALQMDPNNQSAHHLLAQVLQQTNRADEARKEFEAAERLRATPNQ